MKVRILFSESIHYGLAASSRVLAYAKGLQLAGVEVEIAMPYTFLKSDVMPFKQVGVFEGVSYRYLSFSRFNPFEKYKKGVSHFFVLFNIFFSYIKFITYTKFKCRRREILFIYYFGNLFSLLILLFNIDKVRVSELCEIPYHDKLGINRVVRRKIREKFIFPHFDGFVVISENLREYISKISKSKISIVKIPILYEPSIVFKEKQHPNVPYFIHCGSLTEAKDGIVSILDTFGMAKRELNIDFHYYITGYLQNSPDRIAINEVIERNGIRECVFFKGFVSKQELQTLQLGAALAIINKVDNEMNHYNFPTKLSEYLASEVAVIASEIGEVKSFLTNNLNVYFYKPNDLKGLLKCIKDAMQNKDKRLRISINGRKIAEDSFSYVLHGRRLKEFFEELILKI